MFKSSGRRADGGQAFEIDQFGVHAGNVIENPHNVRTIDAGVFRARKSRGSLHVLVETAQGRAIPEDLCNELLATIADTYFALDGSVTRGLREAILAANVYLFDRNLRTDGEHRLLVGLGVIVARGADLYIGQLGPALVSVVSQGGPTRYPSESTWLHSDSPSAFDLNREPPAGLRRDAEPGLYHAVCSSGDVLLLSSTALSRLGSEQDLVEAVTHTGGGSIRAGLARISGGRDLSVLVLRWPSARLASTPASELPSWAPMDRGASPRKARIDQTARVTQAEDREQDAALNEPQRPTMGEAVTSLPPDSADPPPWMAELEGTTAGTRASDARAGTLRGRAPRDADARDTDVPTDDAYPESVFADEDMDDEPGPVSEPRRDYGELREGLRQGAQKLRDGTEDLLMQVLPDKLPERPSMPLAQDERISLSGRALVAVALAIPLVMLFVVIMTRAQWARSQNEQFGSVQTLALSQYDDAVAMEDVALRRMELYEALATAQKGLLIRPGDETLESLNLRILFDLDEVNIVKRLFHLWRLYEFEDGAVSPTDSSRVVVDGLDVFILNRGSDRVFKFLLNDVGDALQSVSDDVVLLERDELRSGIRLGDMVDIAWLAEGGERTRSTFVTLERTGSLLAYDPQQGIDALPVADSDMWLKPEAIGGYYGNLYVLDPLLGRILKYVPTDNAYTTPPSDYLSPRLNVDLTGAVDMAIDGNVYVLFADGAILKFYNGEPRPFPMRGLPTPMRSPTIIFVSGPQEADAVGYVYVADTGNRRIVQLDKEGNYIRQFQAKPGETHLDRLRGIYVDEDYGRMFILSDKTLWLTNLPSMTEG